MVLSYNETKALVDTVLHVSRDEARSQLNAAMKLAGRSEGEFYAGIVEHGPGLRLTTEQWFELLSRLPN